MIVLITIAGLRPIGLDRDSLNYNYLINSYKGFSNIDISREEPLFWIIAEINRVLFRGSFRSFLMIFAILGITIKLYAIKKLSVKPFLSIIIYILLYFILHEMTQIRQGVACGIFLLSIPDILNKNFKSYLLKIILATMFHYIAIVLIPFYFLNPKNINCKLYIILPFVGLIFHFLPNFVLGVIELIAQILPFFMRFKINFYLNALQIGLHDEINIINIYYTTLIIIYTFSLLNISKFRFEYDILYLKFIGWMLFSFYFFSSIPLISFRLSELLGNVIILFFPSLIFIFKNKLFLTVIVIYYCLLTFINNVFFDKLLNIKFP